MGNLASSPQEAEITRKLAAGDQAAMTLLYDAYGLLLYRAILRLVKHPQIAELVLQESFVTMWQTFHAYNTAQHSLFMWALAICQRKASKKAPARMYAQKAITRA